MQYLSSWGEVLRRSLRDDVYLVNCARCGISTVGYVKSGRFAQMAGELRAGDFVLIQLGHNDKDNDAYVANLEKFVADVRAKGATPVLASPSGCEPLGERYGVCLESRRLAAPEGADGEVRGVSARRREERPSAQLGYDAHKWGSPWTGGAPVGC